MRTVKCGRQNTIMNASAFFVYLFLFLLLLYAITTTTTIAAVVVSAGECGGAACDDSTFASCYSRDITPVPKSFVISHQFRHEQS